MLRVLAQAVAVCLAHVTSCMQVARVYGRTLWDCSGIRQRVIAVSVVS